MEKFTYMSAANVGYIEDLYNRFRDNPEAIDPDWKMFFQGVDFAKNISSGTELSSKELDVYNLIRAYRDYGHFEANLNPLASGPKSFPELSFHNFNLKEDDLEANFEIGSVIGLKNAKLKDIIARLRECYCRTLSVQFADATSTVRAWMVREFEENTSKYTTALAQKKAIHQSILNAESWEKFIHTRYVGKKRFSVEGGDALLPMLESAVESGVKQGVEELVLGMAHRGRVNVLVNFMGKALENIFAEFEGIRDENNSFFDGDVKYHLGYSSDKKTANGNCHVSLAFNPSHLEAVNPVVLGMARAKQRRRKDTGERKKVVPILIHGDGAFAGQGVGAECFTMSQLKGYTVGGTIHICIDNQVAFTTNPENGRSSPYSTDIAKMLQTPVIHVNGDDAEAAVRAMEIAMRFRQEFKRDVVINVLCYRRFGHNEGDEPAFTQPMLYDKIKKHPTLYEIYSKKLQADGVIKEGEADQLFKARIDELQIKLDQTRKSPPEMKPLVFDGLWKGFRRATPEDFKKTTNTTTSLKILKDVAELLTTVPKGFNVHPKIAKLIGERAEMMNGEGSIDWGMGELLSYGALMYEGTPIRLSGQDCVRGTFTHRHSGWYDVKTGESYFPLQKIRPDDVEFCVYDSPLSEYAVMGFEYGNSSSDPTFLTIWEAQFGDFVNGAQIILDQFLSSAEQKWQRMSGLTLLLPHGYEGQGPEHSSARLERFLQLCAQENIQVCNMTTPAQLFHVLRRQIKREFRKPLVIMSPKSLLRHPLVRSKLTDFTEGTFQEVITDASVKAATGTAVILSTGKVYYDLLAKRATLAPAQQEKVALVRVEQMYPFPEHRLVPLLNGYGKLDKVVWCQEEPKNMGAWSFMQPRLMDMFDAAGLDLKVTYAGRTERASPATGSEKVHQHEQADLVALAFEQAGISAAAASGAGAGAASAASAGKSSLAEKSAPAKTKKK